VKIPIVLLLGLVTFLGVSACGDGDDTATGPPRAPTNDVVERRDDLGRVVNVPVVARRVVAMSPSIVELMYAVGAAPAGRPSSANFPEAAKSVAAFGTSYEPNFEEIVRTQPDLIIADAIIQGQSINELARLGAPVFALRVSSFEDVTRGMRVVGSLTGRIDAAEAQVRELEGRLITVRSRLPATRGPSVLIVLSAGPQQFIAAKETSYLGSLVKALGGRNIVTSEPENFRFPGFADYSLESIVQADPDVVIAISVGGPEGTPQTTEILGRTPVWSSLAAVKAGMVKEVDPVVYLEAPGPRASQILDELPRILYPAVFVSR
jgi:iron complex transport system substrate-binding protein